METARYDQIADSYATEFGSVGDPVSQAVLALAGQLARKRVLDIACGHGRLTRELASRGADVSGIDISAALVAKARALEGQRSLGIKYVVADIARWQPPEPAAFGRAVDAAARRRGQPPDAVHLCQYAARARADA